MPICFDRKLLFVHIPKTGGTIIESIAAKAGIRARIDRKEQAGIAQGGIQAFTADPRLHHGQHVFGVKPGLPEHFVQGFNRYGQRLFGGNPVACH